MMNRIVFHSKNLILFFGIISFVSVEAKELNQVFKKTGKNGNYELIKLFDDKTAEHLIYEKENLGSSVEKNELVYHQKGTILLLSPKNNIFNSFLYHRKLFVNDGLYLSWFDANFRKGNSLFKNAPVKKYDKPYWFDPINQSIVNNLDNLEQVDLNLLVKMILQKKISEKQQALELADYICRSVDYDYNYLKTGNYANDQNDAKAILAGRNRKAVCEGYAKTFKALCDAAGIKCDYVVGYSRQSFSDISKLGNYHAWNVVWIDDRPFIFDVTWADGGDDHWLMTNPEMMIYSHFPNDPKYQLLEEEVTEDEFRKMCVVKPINRSYVGFSPNNGVLYANDGTIEIKFEGKVSVELETVDPSVFNYSYSKSNSYSYESNNEKMSKLFDGDSTVITIDIEEPELAIRLIVDHSFEIRYHLINKKKEDYYAQQIIDVKKNEVQSLIRGFCAAIMLKDEYTINQIAPLIETSFGGLELLSEHLGEWDGTIGELTKVTSHQITMNEKDELVETTEFYHEVEVHDQFIIEVELVGKEWQIIKVHY